MFDMQTAIKADNALPANAFRINGDAVLQEGIQLELYHPLCKETPAAFVGSYFIKRDSRNGCFYTRSGNKAYARRVQIDLFDIDGPMPVRVLRRPEYENLPLLLQIDPSVDLGKNVKLQSGIQFWTGVEHTGTNIHRCFRSGEAMIEMPEGATATIFYSDGRVARVLNSKSQLSKLTLTLEEQAKLRIEQALAGISSAKGDPKSEDFWYHQLVTILATGGKRSRNVFETVYTIIGNAAGSGKMGVSVKDRALDVLSKISPGHVLALEMAFETRHSANKPRFAEPTLPKAPTHKGPPPEVQQRRAERAERNRAERESMRGKSGGTSNTVTAVNPRTIARNERKQARAKQKK